LQFGFVIFWPKNIGTKAACKMLVKLTPVEVAVLQAKVTVAVGDSLKERKENKFRVLLWVKPLLL